MSDQPLIYFHVGLGKVASTYLQKEVFPKMKGVHYVPTHRYKKSKEIIPQLKDSKVLVSREFDRQFEDEVRWFTQTYPQARIIMLLRRQDDWIASQYKRHVKNGFFHPFEEFIDLDEDSGFWKKKELFYMPKLKVIAACTSEKPLILFYEDFKSDPKAFIRSLCDYMQVEVPSNLSTKVVHGSFSEKQLKVLRVFCYRFIRVVPTNYQNKWKHWLLYRPVWAFYHLILYAAKLIPEALVANDPLIHKSSLERVRESCDSDWGAVKSTARDSG